MRTTRDDDRATPVPVAGAEIERFQRLLEGLSLNGSEARTVLALMRLGSATMSQLAQATGISRPNLYPVLDSLQARGVAERLAGRYAVWQSSGPAEVLAALEAAEEARAAASRESFQRRLEEAKAGLAELPTTPEQTKAVISLDDDARMAVFYEEALATVEGEILVLNRGPYAGDVEPFDEVLDSLARGVRARAMYQAHELNDPALRHCADVYAAAGVEQRVIETLPVAMAVLGERLVLLALPKDDDVEAIDSHTATVRNRGMVQLVSAAFDHLWDQGQPYVGSKNLSADP